MAQSDKREDVEKAPRPSQAEGEGSKSGSSPSGSTPDEGDVGRPSQAEGSEEDVDEAIERQEQKRKR